MVNSAKLSVLALIAAVATVGCSSAMKARQAEREKVSASSGFYCEFVNGEDYDDIDVQVNIQMAKKCDANKSFSISDYKTTSDLHGMVFCCALARDERPAVAVSKPAPPPPEPAKVEAPTAPEPPKPAAKAPAKPAAKATAKGKADDKADVLGD